MLIENMGVLHVIVDGSPDQELAVMGGAGCGSSPQVGLLVGPRHHRCRASCSDPRGSQRRWGEGVHTVTAAGRSTQSPHSGRAREEHLCARMACRRLQ